MKKDKAMRLMKEEVVLSKGDEELAHVNADDILCSFLVELGHGDLVEVYKKVDKWYA